MLPFLGFLSNPITKLVADKVIGAASHAMEKKKIIRAAEIEATKELDIVKLETHILKGWELLNNAPDMFWVIILTIVGGSFGVNTLNKWKK